MAKDSNRRCSHCGNNGHNSRTCNDRGLKLFGVRIKGEGEVVIRKSMSMGNLASFAAEQSSNDHGYLSDGLVNSSTIRNERKRGVPWTEEEHRTFLAGLEKLGKGDWRGISKNFVTTRTPTQVASHAQKYFLRQVAPKKTKRRLSLFDLVSNDTVVSTDNSPALSLGITGDAQEENHLHSNCYSAGSSGGIKNPVIDGASEISATLSLGTKHEISDICLSDFLQLSFSQATGFSPESYPHWTSKVTQFPVSSAKSLSLENGDLELSIAPPRPDNPFKFESPIINVAGIVRVV